MTIDDPLLHIHSAPGVVCAACGDADDGTRVFLTDAGKWNGELRTCSPSTVIRPNYSISGRDDPRTSALKGERFPDIKKVPDIR